MQEETLCGILNSRWHCDLGAQEYRKIENKMYKHYTWNKGMMVFYNGSHHALDSMIFEFQGLYGLEFYYKRSFLQTT